MKLARIRKNKTIIPVVIISNNKAIDCSSLAKDWDGPFYEKGGLEQLRKDFETLKDRLPEIDVEPRDFDAAIPRPGKIVCIGLNYSDHAKEAGMEEPKEPIVFMKASSALSGPNDPIRKPRKSEALDWEVELGIVIGKKTRYLKPESDTLSHIAGYTIANDVSERDFQLKHGGQWTKGKSHDTFCPVGPWISTTDEVPNPGELNLTLTVNGQTRQNGNTSTMIFPVYQIIHYLSQFMTLEAGDLILTGTPPGVAAGMTPPQWLQVGDVVALSIDGLGTQSQTIIADE